MRIEMCAVTCCESYKYVVFFLGFMRVNEPIGGCVLQNVGENQFGKQRNKEKRSRLKSIRGFWNKTHRTARRRL